MTLLKQPETPVRVVVCAANRYGELIVCGARHFDMVMRAQIKAANLVRATPEQGFIDQWGVFMSREEALAVATAAGQINVRRPKNPPFDELFSEDIY